MLEALQRARGSMLEDGGEACKALAPQEPISVCGSAGEPRKDRSWDRQDLFCEMVTWQWEELGDGNPAEFKANGCTFNKKAKGKKGDARKGQAFSRDDL